MSNFNLKETIDSDVDLAIKEDLGSGDLTSSLIPAETIGQGAILSRVDCVLSGSAWANATFQKLDPSITLDWQYQDGDRVAAGEIICKLQGPARALLTGERTALNFLQTLSAVATKTRRYVDAISHTKATILDTRKTLPGLRKALKYAVRVGGGKNHRIGLYDGVLIKENHITASNGITAALAATRHIDKTIPIQVEVESLEQLKEALDNGANLILLDNFTVPQMKDAVALTNKRALLEASGGITMSSIVAIAETGVDRISIGTLTKDIDSIDLSMRLVF
ncbi:MAG: carboxylating nicotinate-nucleotide diphosphorylase [Burkholderiales bacterium]|jgi:nicotinate-nucleotide pyrophosphorylase (carboxylating)|nr:carboxylating nicotinate-nucleotide diphosphorylase [Burkholderiales bacterium]